MEVTDQPEGMKRRSRVPPLAVLAVALLPIVFGLVDVIQDTTFGQPSGIRLSPNMIPGVLLFYFVLAGLTPGVHEIVSRTLRVGSGARRTLALHFLGGASFALVHLSATMFLQRAVIPHEADVGLHFANMTRMFLLSSVMWYVVLAASFHALLYYLRSRDSEVATARLATQMAEGRMSALGSQLGPHFLFNTLSTIEALAERGDTREVIQVVHDLSDLLREVRREGLGPTTSVARESALLAKYLRILDVRFGSRLAAAVHVEPSAWRAEVPVLTLQLLVENAVKHGYRARTEGLRVEVDIRRSGRQLHVRVADSGPGFSANGHSTGIGLSNLRARLQALYGPASEVQTGGSPLGGAQVVVSLPFRVWEEPVSQSVDDGGE